MFGYEAHRTTLQANRNMIQLELSHPPLQDTRPKTTHITSTLSRNFPLHKSSYYKSYKYNVLNNSGRLPGGQRGATAQSAPNFTKEQVTFPMWSKPFRPKQTNSSRKIANPSYHVLSVANNKSSQVQVPSSRPSPARPNTRQQEDLPPIVNKELRGGSGQPTPPPIRVTFNYNNRMNTDKSMTPCSDHTEVAEEQQQLTLQKYTEFLKLIGHKDLTHNSYTKVENWLRELDLDGTWPVQWFSSKRT